MASMRNKWKKRRAIYLLTACGKDEEEVARQLSIKKATVQKWMRQSAFQEELEKSIQRIEKYDGKYRAKQNAVIAARIIDEVHRRFNETNQLEKLPLSTLLGKLREVNNEIRIDTPGDVTSRDHVEHRHELMDKLVQLYKERTQNEGECHLKLVEMPDKEVSNG